MNDEELKIDEQRKPITEFDCTDENIKGLLKTIDECNRTGNRKPFVTSDGERVDVMLILDNPESDAGLIVGDALNLLACLAKTLSRLPVDMAETFIKAFQMYVDEKKEKLSHSPIVLTTKGNA